jgi:uncharacterized protein (DUF983 family)
MKTLHENRIILWRGLRRRCPQCGQGQLFAGWSRLNRTCSSCDFDFVKHEGDTWAFMYLSTAFITGFFIVVMFWIPPNNLWMGRILLASAALFFFYLTWPFRKGLAIAFNYLIELRYNNFSGLKLRNITKRN